MRVDAIVLAGGRSARLGGEPKALLRYDGMTLLQRSVSVARGLCERVVVLGDVAAAEIRDVIITRENPPFGGPVAGIGAGMDALAQGSASRFTVVLACDMPHIEYAVAALADAAQTAGAEDVSWPDGFIAVDTHGRQQPLAALYRTAALTSALDARRRSGGLDGCPVFSLIADLALEPVPVPESSTDDVDSWEDARAFGIRSSNLAQPKPLN